MKPTDGWKDVIDQKHAAERADLMNPCAETVEIHDDLTPCLVCLLRYG
jgi:hypothetical protein